MPADEILAEMNRLKAEEISPEDGRMFAYVYTGDSSSFELQKKGHKLFTGGFQIRGILLVGDTSPYHLVGLFQIKLDSPWNTMT